MELIRILEEGELVVELEEELLLVLALLLLFVVVPPAEFGLEEEEPVEYDRCLSAGPGVRRCPPLDGGAAAAMDNNNETLRSGKLLAQWQDICVGKSNTSRH